MLRRFLIAKRDRLTATTRAADARRGGLRIADVAARAGVTARWYGLFEAGSGVRRFSAAFVERVASALELDRPGRAKLFRLALAEVAEAVEYFESHVRGSAVADADESALNA